MTDIEGLVRSAVGGSKADFDKLMMRCEAPVRRHLDVLVARCPGLVESADDLLQLVSFEASRAIGRFDPCAGGSFVGWLMKIADSKYKDAVKRQFRARRGGGWVRVRSATGVLGAIAARSSAAPSRVAMRKELLAEARAAIATLPAVQQAVVDMTYGEQLDDGEIGRRMGKTAGAIRALLQRARAGLRERLARHLDGSSGDGSNGVHTR